jgi:hypothetical protein
LWIITILCVPVAILKFSESLSIWRARNYPVVEGKILGREPLKALSIRRLIAPSDQITIQITGTETKAQAIMFKSASKKLPEYVRFHFSGNTNDKIFIEGQGNPLWPSLFICGLLILIWALYLNRNILFALLVLKPALKRGHYP